uniref:Uncharacterized protein n=1 Tax=viral metagenome TaxID=1070528 RepID=A0A6M3XUU5_9ZZZZ
MGSPTSSAGLPPIDPGGVGSFNPGSTPKDYGMYGSQQTPSYQGFGSGINQDSAMGLDALSSSYADVKDESNAKQETDWKKMFKEGLMAAGQTQLNDLIPFKQGGFTPSTYTGWQNQPGQSYKPYNNWYRPQNTGDNNGLGR